MVALVQRKEYDAVVVGSGITGGYAAKELTEKGLETLVLEAGRPINPTQDYVEHVQPWDLKFRGLRNRARQSRDQPIQKNCYACDEWSSKFFVNDHENPYTFPKDKPFDWIRGRHVGGRSIMWARQTYRWSDLDFEANARDGVGVDWPIRYEDIAPWYDYVEEFVGISGQKEGLPQLPDGKFLPPMELNCAELRVRDALEGKFADERMLTIGRCAVLTEAHNGRAPCHYCGPCRRGCITRSYFSSLNATLPVARATGRLTLRPYSVVDSVIYDEVNDRAKGFRVIDAVTHESFEVYGKVVFLCASAMESARILLNSKTARFSDGLCNSSGEVGRNFDGPRHGRRCRGNPSRQRGQDALRKASERSLRSAIQERQQPEPGFSPRLRLPRRWLPRALGARSRHARLRRRLQALTPRLRTVELRFYGFGECLPSAGSYVEIDPEVKDKWGVPAIRVHMTYGENELALMKDAAVSAAEMLDASGATGIETFIQDNRPGLAIHEMGTARMGRDPNTSVLNAHNQAHDVPNLFVTDGACMTSSSCVNPSITYMALTARAYDYAVKQMDLGHIG